MKGDCMNRVVIEQVLAAYKAFEFERAHEKFLREIERAFKKLNEEQQKELASFLELYEEAYKNSDVIRICDIICYYIYPFVHNA